ncbi:MAG: twin-arginine translocation signal domain-containing protein [Candidatus Sumerlaeia bacterium]|nr:twin-arginine translocation signal domain-containing protein [Candidatus Sumerlaeia bacterium]
MSRKANRRQFLQHAAAASAAAVFPATQRPADATRLREAFDHWNAQLIPARFPNPQAKKKAKRQIVKEKKAK